jgi:transposase
MRKHRNKSFTYLHYKSRPQNPELVLLSLIQWHGTTRLTMPPFNISHDLKAQIPILHHNLGYSVKEIKMVLGIKKSLIYKTLYFYRVHGLTYNPYITQLNHHQHLTSIDVSFIWGLLHQKHAIYLDEIQEQLLIRRGIKISLSTLICTLHTLSPVLQQRCFKACTGAKQWATSCFHEPNSRSSP